MTPDIIGPIVKNQATYNEDGSELTPPVFAEGFHVNTPVLVPEWESYLCDPQPATPYRVYAGNIIPVCYRFADESEFIRLWQTDEDY